jgi:enoyl-CoA hydratase/carnithine racemase
VTHINTTIERGVATLWLNRPEKRNALSVEMLSKLGHDLIALASNPDVAVVLLRGAGKSFCVGADISEFAQHDSNSARRSWIPTGHRVAGILAEMPQPTIAVIQGHAIGGGLELALACDFRVATVTSKLGLPEVGLGTLPGWGGSGRLAAAVGPVRAKEMVLLSKIVNGEEAARIGLVSTCTTDEGLEDGVDPLVGTLLAQPAVAAQLAKQVMNSALAPTHQLETFEALAGALSVATEDLREGIDAFTEKREPRFRGK